jgi:hypothetical protein
VAICRICLKTYDELAYQITVPLLEESFDRVECAEAALQKYLRATRRSTDNALSPMNASDWYASDRTRD